MRVAPNVKMDGNAVHFLLPLEVQYDLLIVIYTLLEDSP